MRRFLVILAVSVAFAGCTAQTQDPPPGLQGAKAFRGDGGYVTYAISTTLDDGTRCVVVFGNSPGRGVSCDWRN